MKRVCEKIFILFIISLITPLSVFAQAISVTKNPPFPKDGEMVAVAVTAFGFDLKNSLITWKEGKETLFEGVGATEYTVKSANNQIIVIHIFNQKTGEKFTQSVPITTSQVDLLWEAIGSYTPPFYKGKALPALEANINVVAIPDFDNREVLTYSWEKENQRQASQGGRGKNSFGYIASPLEQANKITVNVSSADESFSGNENLIIRYGNSEVLFYENSSDFGTLFNKVITNGHSVGEDGEISLTAIPFFVTADTIASKSLEMIWSVNGLALPVQTIKNKVRLSGEGGVGGEVIASIFIKNKARLFEEGTVGVGLNF